MVVGSSPNAVTYTSDIAAVSSKEFLDIQGTIECGFTLKLARDMIRTYNQVKTFFNPANTQCSFKESFKKKRKTLTGICSLSTWFSKQILNLCHNIGLFKTLSII